MIRSASIDHRLELTYLQLFIALYHTETIAVAVVAQPCILFVGNLPGADMTPVLEGITSCHDGGQAA
jgi:hypothetical protein